MAEIYLAGKVDSNEGALSDFADELEQRGHRITLKWWEGEPLKRPYLKYKSESRNAAITMEQAVRSSDVAILFPTAKILGAAVELGIAIGDTTKEREVIVVMSDSETSAEARRQSVFYVHPKVIAAQSLHEVRLRPWY